MATIQADILRRSVTRDETAALASTYRFWIAPMAGPAMVSMDYEPPPYWTPESDVKLREVYRRGGLWSSAVNIAVTRMMVAGYELDGDVALRVRRARELLGAGWIDFVTGVGTDYCVTDNGGFAEIVRATKAYGSRVLGFVHLSSLRCIRTGDPERPVIYLDRIGKYHELRAHQVVDFSDMPDSDFYGVGMCATRRAWDYIYEHRAVSAYFKEKATGRRPLELVFMAGMGDEGIRQAIQSAQEDADRQGRQGYMGIAITGNPNDVPLKVERVPLASLPDGFNQETHEELTQIRFAATLGIDPSDLNPRLIGNRSLGAGSQSQVLDEKQDSKGLIALRSKFVQWLNDTERWHPLPGGVTFAWSERDLRDQQMKAGISQTRATTRKTQIESGEITPIESRQLAVDDGDLPESFIAQDQTTEETLTDEDKATEGLAETAVNSAQESDAEVEPVVTPGAPAPAVTLAEFKEHTGAMVALYPPMSQVLAIMAGLDAVEWPDGAQMTLPSEMHITLAFLGEAADIDDARRKEMIGKARNLLEITPAEVRFNGVARFNGSPEDGDPIVVLLSSPELNVLATSARLEIGDESDHPFLAHMTLAYIPKDAPTPTVPPLFESLRIDRLSLVFADEAIAEFNLGTGVSVPKVEAALGAALKAASTELVALSPAPRRGRVRDGYWNDVTKELDEYGRLLTIALRQHMPQDTGDMARSVRYQVTQKGTPNATLQVFVGNKSRPEVAVRSVLFGRRGFAAKRGKVLRFRVGDQTVFARKVRGALSQDFMAKAWTQTKAQRDAMEERLARHMNVEMIEVSDIPGAIKRTRLDQIKAPATPKRRRKK